VTKTDATCRALIALAVGLVLGLYVGWSQAVWYYEEYGREEPAPRAMYEPPPPLPPPARVERLEEVEEIEPERVEQ